LPNFTEENTQKKKKHNWFWQDIKMFFQIKKNLYIPKIPPPKISLSLKFFTCFAKKKDHMVFFIRV